MAGIIDAFEFVRTGGALSGETPVARFKRLLVGHPEQTAGALAQWSAQAGRGPLGEPLIRLHVQADLVLRCERCLEPFTFQAESEVALHIVETEAELGDGGGAEDEDDADAPEGFEMVVGSRRFDLAEQVEDELILCVPYVPKHESCPAPGPGAESPESLARPSPFAALAKLRQGGD